MNVSKLKLVFPNWQGLNGFTHLPAFSDLWEREVRRFIKEAKLAEKRLAQAKVEEMRKQHNSSRENQRTSTTSGDPNSGCSTPPMRKSKLKSRLRESKTMDQIKS